MKKPIIIASPDHLFSIPLKIFSKDRTLFPRGAAYNNSHSHKHNTAMSNASFPPPSPLGIDAQFKAMDINSNQHLRDLKLAIEYKYLRHHAPGGVFLSKFNRNIAGLSLPMNLLRRNYTPSLYCIALPKMYTSDFLPYEIEFSIISGVSIRSTRN